MKILNNQLIFFSNQQIKFNSKILFNFNSDAPIQFHYAEFLNKVGKIEYFENGIFKILNNLTLSEFKEYLPQYEDFVSQLKAQELNQYGEPKYKEIDGELVEQTEPSLEWIKADLEEKTYSFYDSEPIRLATIQTTDGKSFNYEIKTQALLKLSLVLLTNKDYLYFDKSSGVSIKLTPSKIQHIYDTLMEIGVQNKNIFEQHLANIRSLDEKQDYDYSSGYLKDNVINLANL